MKFNRGVPVPQCEESTGNAIDVTDLRRSYAVPGDASYEVVRGLTFDVRFGELFALLGTNGAGKTSTVELLEGLARPDGGRVRVFGVDPYGSRHLVRPRTGVMLQSGGFPNELTVRETARLWSDCTTAARPLTEVLDIVGLSGRAEVRVGQLSGGELRRLDLALAVLGEPDILFLDEPTTGMDPEGRRATWEIVRSLRAEGTTVLLTTHYLEEAEELADRIAIMHQGEIVMMGTPAEVISAYPSQISFELPRHLGDRALPELPELPGVDGIARSDTKVVIWTHCLQETLTPLLIWAHRSGVTLTELNARSASLEEAFLAVSSGSGPGRPQHGHEHERECR